ncbi:LysR family transcriptional regulator [Acetobacter senegalensis]|uniref:LysR family transcriptional regulator n=1 Tax=Acetobacter senegalensis TaxID=446692 RepID=UPI0020A1DE8B|nr:LysR family transcriptional regulator [Acetobacter senegalensis]MCP1196639.1 LysR family transcriptional regulator [Acetobacter senegalensis]
MQVAQLRLLIEINRLNSLSRAADVLGLTQSTASRHLNALEATVGKQLAERSWSGVHLTIAGQRLVVHAQKILDQINLAKDELNGQTVGTTPVIVLAAYAGAVATFIPTAIRATEQKLQHIKIQLEVIPSEDAENIIMRNKANVAVTLADHHMLKKSRQDELKLHPLVQEELFCALSNNHRLARQDFIDIEDIKDELFVLHPNANGPLYRTFFSDCASHGFTPRQISTTSDFLTRFGIVASCTALTLAPAAVIIENKPSGIVFKSFRKKIQSWIVTVTKSEINENEKFLLTEIYASAKIHFHNKF